MLIDFSLRNWRSFGEEAGFSMLPSRERRFAWTLPTFDTAPKKLLPIAVFYGANASGKSNLLKGLFFLASYVIHGSDAGEEIPVEPYQLDPQKKSEPTSFSILFRTHEKVYQYEMELTKKEIIREKLTLLLPREERVLYDRENEEINIHTSVYSQRAQFVFEGTQKNSPFLTAAYKQKIDFVAYAYEWFKNSLKFIDINRQIDYEKIYENNSSFQEKLAWYLSKYDTGISGILSKEKTANKDDLFNEIYDFININNMPYFGERNRLQIQHDGDKITVRVLNAIHKDTEGNTIYFSFKNESCGTNRLIDLLQALIEPDENSDNEYVYIIDEVDRSIHPNLLCQFITDFLMHSSTKSRAQLIVTTHNTSLMNQNILRRDEIWITDKNLKGSTLYSISDFKIPDNMKYLRFDKILDKLYMEGRLGGVPRIVSPSLPIYKYPEDRQ